MGRYTRRCKEAEDGAAVALATAREEAAKAVAREKQAAFEALRASREEADRAKELVKEVRFYYGVGGRSYHGIFSFVGSLGHARPCAGVSTPYVLYALGEGFCRGGVVKDAAA